MTRPSMHMTPEGEKTLDRLIRLLSSADGEGYEITVLLHTLVLARLQPSRHINNMNDMLGLDLRLLAPLAEALAAGVEKKLIVIEVPGLTDGDSLTHFEEGRKRIDVVKLMRLHFEAGDDRRKQPLVNYAPGNNPFAADHARLS